jgi:hypothetical protein
MSNVKQSGFVEMKVHELTAEVGDKFLTLACNSCLENFQEKNYAEYKTKNYKYKQRIYSKSCRALTTEAAGQLEILWLATQVVRMRVAKAGENIHSDTLSVDGSQVSILKEGDEVSLSSFLEGHNGRRLESEIGLIVCRKTGEQRFECKVVWSDLEQFHGRGVGRATCE